MEKTAIIIYGPPGSGKGTQAELLARKYNFIHFDSGRYIESLVHDKALQKNPIIRRERKNFDTGILCTPTWVLKIVTEATARIAKAGYGIVYSGSLRTMFESFGDKKNKGLLLNLVKFYGRKNIRVLALKVRPASSLKRNSSRRVCSVCGMPMLAKFTHRECDFCEGLLRKRTLDTPSVIKVRLKQYADRTYPIIARMKKNGFRVIEINGEPAPYKIHALIVKKLGLE